MSKKRKVKYVSLKSYQDEPIMLLRRKTIKLINNRFREMIIKIIIIKITRVDIIEILKTRKKCLRNFLCLHFLLPLLFMLLNHFIYGSQLYI